MCAAAFAALPVFSPVQSVSAGRTVFDVERELNECRSALAELQAEMKDISARIDELKRQSSATDVLLAAYAEQIEALDAEIAATEQIKESYDFKRAAAHAQLIAVQQSYEAHCEMYKGLMEFIYENSGVSDFELLFTSKSIADYLSRKDDMNDLMTSAAELLKDIQNDMSDAEILENTLAETQAYYEAYISELAKSELEKKRVVGEYRTIAESLGLDADRLLEDYGSTNSKAAALRARIKELENERALLYSASSDYAWPLPAGTSYYVSSGYGWRRHPFNPSASQFHEGLDIACARGTKILASKSGVVSYVGTNPDYGYGYYVIIYHGNGISTLYGHMDRLPPVSAGQSVAKGEVIGYVGTTGSSTGYHLHFTVLNENYVDAIGTHREDPGKYLPDGYYRK